MSAAQLLKLIGHTDEKYILSALNTREGARELPKKRSIGRMWLIAAILTITIPITVLAASRYLHLTDYLKRAGMGDTQGVTSLSSNMASEKTFRNELAEYQILEASCDSKTVYLVARVKAVDEGNLVVPQYVTGGESVKTLGIEGITEGTIEEYAQAQNKDLVYVGLSVTPAEGQFDGMSEDIRCDRDGTLYCYLTAKNQTEASDIRLNCVGSARLDGSDEILNVKFETRIQDRSTSEEMVFTTFDSRIPEEIRIFPEKLVVKETELGMYAALTYRVDPNRASKTKFFVLVDENGEELARMPDEGGSFTDNGDGSYTSTFPFQKVDSLEGVKIQFSHHEPYSFGK